MILFLQLNVHLGMPPGKYLANSKHLLVPGADWELLQEVGLVELREATYDEQTRFIEENEGGKGGIVWLGDL